MRTIDEILEDILLSNEITGDEKAYFDKWQETEKQNKLFDLLRAIPAGADLSRNIDRNEEAVLKKMRSEISARQRKRRLSLVASVAASVLFVLTGGFLYYSLTSSPDTPAPASSKESFRAELILPGGKVIALNADTGDTIRPYDRTTWFHEAQTITIHPSETALAEVSYTTFRIPLGGEYNIILPDGTKVFMNSGSELIFPNCFSDNERRVTLNGEAYFDVTRDTIRPFIVQANDLFIHVLGTAFNVNAYSSMKSQAVTLESGFVKVACNDREFLLDPGQQIKYDSDSRLAEVREVNTELYTSWKNGFYFFQEITLEEIMNTLKHWYGITVIFEDDWSRNREFSGHMKRYDQVEVLLNHFRQTQEITYRKEGDTIYIRKK